MTDHLDIKEFDRICRQRTVRETLPNAFEIQEQIPIYLGKDLRKQLPKTSSRKAFLRELYTCLKDGPGILIIEGFYQDLDIVDRNTQIFWQIIASEKNQKKDAGDHFAKSGANERIWNSFQKVTESSPIDFAHYYKNPLYQLVSEAWLGPGYQITAQVNIVKPGGDAQSAHRDYHLGFQNNDNVAQFPPSLQVASQYLTLQGAIAHTDMPIESGPTLFLPFSQQYEHGYLAWRDERFQAYFSEQAVQLPLNKGDALFFSPAVFHGAGSNTTHTDRIANLIQVSACFGKPMESIDRQKLCALIYPLLINQSPELLLTSLETECLIAAVADGYAFPSNLDKETPIGEAAPMNDQQLLAQAVKEKWDLDQLITQLSLAMKNRSNTDA